MTGMMAAVVVAISAAAVLPLHSGMSVAWPLTPRSTEVYAFFFRRSTEVYGGFLEGPWKVIGDPWGSREGSVANPTGPQGGREGRSDQRRSSDVLAAGVGRCVSTRRRGGYGGRCLCSGPAAGLRAQRSGERRVKFLAAYVYISGLCFLHLL